MPAMMYVEEERRSKFAYTKLVVRCPLSKRSEVDGASTAGGVYIVDNHSLLAKQVGVAMELVHG
jgi:hypothetical protein